MIYLDNAATTYPKPPNVNEAIINFTKLEAGNPGRGGHKYSVNSADIVFECRENMCKLINCDNPESIIFTKNATEALNIAMKGTLRRGDEVIISGMEHNSVARCAAEVSKHGVIVKIAKGNKQGLITAESVKECITPKTKLICVIHSSNIVGTVNDIESIFEYARKKNILTLADCSQSGGCISFDCNCCDMAAFAGHKGLYGPFGTGILYVGANVKISPLCFGGTGSLSESSDMPDIMPDRLEAGTLNVLGIAGLNQGIGFVIKEDVYSKEKMLTDRLYSNLKNMRGIEIYGNNDSNLIGLNITDMDNVDVSARLNDEYSIAVRSGLHCSPLAHRTLGTVSTGLLRISVGYFNTISDIDSVCFALNKIIM